jgi:Translin family
LTTELAQHLQESIIFIQLQNKNKFGEDISLRKIQELANQQPYYKYNGIWSRHMETLSFCIIFMSWLGWDVSEGKFVFREEGNLLTYEQVARRMGGKHIDTGLI